LFYLQFVEVCLQLEIGGREHGDFISLGLELVGILLRDEVREYSALTLYTRISTGPSR
jgi:hypothetical protein